MMLLSIIIVFLVSVNDEVLGQFPENCGERRQVTKIVGGNQAYIGQFPWLARLHQGFSDTEYCGGVIITELHVLTAAHCTVKPYLHVRLGDNFSRKSACEGGVCTPNVQDIRVVYAYSHPAYNTRNHANDIQLLKLAKKIKFNEFVQPACMPVETIFKEKQTGEVEVAGWGSSHPTKIEIPDKLLYATLEITSMSDCKQIFGKLNDLTQYCVGGYDGVDSCVGDSGGPITKAYKFKGKMRHYVLGLVSFGLPTCGEAPAVYTNIYPYLPWIRNLI